MINIWKFLFLIIHINFSCHGKINNSFGLENKPDRSFRNPNNIWYGWEYMYMYLFITKQKKC